MIKVTLDLDGDGQRITLKGECYESTLYELLRGWGGYVRTVGDLVNKRVDITNHMIGDTPESDKPKGLEGLR